METTRICPRCKQGKLLQEFGYARSRRNGRSCYCRACNRERSRAINKTEHRRQYQRAYRRRRRQTPRGIYESLCHTTRHPVQLTANEFVEWFNCQDQRCYYCGQEVICDVARGPNNRTVDRKDNTKGYSLDNIVLCCRRCNVVKSDVFTAEQMLEIAAKYF